MCALRNFENPPNKIKKISTTFFPPIHDGKLYKSLKTLDLVVRVVSDSQPARAADVEQAPVHLRLGVQALGRVHHQPFPLT